MGFRLVASAKNIRAALARYNLKPRTLLAVKSWEWEVEGGDPSVRSSALDPSSSVSPPTPPSPCGAAEGETVPVLSPELVCIGC